VSCEYWKRRYDTLVDILKEEYGSAAVIDLLVEVTERIDRETQKHRTEKISSEDIDLSDSWFMYCKHCGKTTLHKDTDPCGSGAVGVCTVCGCPNRHI